MTDKIPQRVQDYANDLARNALLEFWYWYKETSPSNDQIKDKLAEMAARF